MQCTVRVAEPNPVLASLLLEQFGGRDGELSAATRYFAQGLSDEDPGRKDLLLDIATEELTKAARKAGMNPPPTALDPGALASINELQSVGADDFDRIYLGQQVPAHQAALDLHKSFGTKGDSAPLRAPAKKAVPIVHQHLNAAQRMQQIFRPAIMGCSLRPAPPARGGALE